MDRIMWRKDNVEVGRIMWRSEGKQVQSKRILANGKIDKISEIGV